MKEPSTIGSQILSLTPKTGAAGGKSGFEVIGADGSLKHSASSLLKQRAITVIDIAALYAGIVVDQVIPPSVEYSIVLPAPQGVEILKLPELSSQILSFTPNAGAAGGSHGQLGSGFVINETGLLKQF